MVRNVPPFVPILEVLWLVASGGSARGDAMQEQDMLIHFRADRPGPWTAVHDRVMGGASRGGIRLTERGTGLFTGVISLANRGGFASVRTVPGRTDLSGCDGLELRARGDGRTYQLRLRTDDSLDGIAYRAEFATREGEWITVRLPFDLFRPTFRGRKPRDAPPLDVSRIRQAGFLLADGQAGPFALEIDFVRTWPSGGEEP